MAAKPVKISILADTKDLQQGLGRAEGAMNDAAATAKKAGSKIDGAFSGVADASDGVASASSQAAGGLGDLGGALSTMPGPLGKVGSSMETTAPLIMGVTGAADLLNLATEKFPGLAKAQTAATKVMGKVNQIAAGATRALGTAMRFAMGPIGLIIIAITAIVAVIVLLYKKNEAFRNFVDAAWAKIKAAMAAVMEWLRDKVPPIWAKFKAAAVAVFAWLRDKVPPIWAKFRDAAAKVFAFYRDKVWPVYKTVGTKIWNSIKEIKDKVVTFVGTIREKFEAMKNKWAEVRDKVENVKESIKTKFNNLVEFVGGLPGRIAKKAAGMWDSIKENFRGAINRIIGWWNDLQLKINIPDKIPGLPGSFTISTPNVPQLASGGIVTSPTLAVIGEAGPEAVVPLGRGFGGGNTYNITVHAPVGASSADIGRSLVKHIDAYERAGGRRRA